MNFQITKKAPPSMTIIPRIEARMTNLFGLRFDDFEKFGEPGNGVVGGEIVAGCSCTVLSEFDAGSAACSCFVPGEFDARCSSHSDPTWRSPRATGAHT